MATLTPEQIDQYYASQSGATNPLSPTDWLAQQQTFTAPTAQQPIATDSLNTTTQAPLANYQPYQAPTVNYQDLYNQFQAPTAQETQYQQEQTGILSSIEDLINQQGQYSARESQLSTEAGIPDIQKNINDYTNQINTLTAQAKQMEATSEARQASGFAIKGEQAQIQQQLAAKTYGLAAAKSALTGDLALAQQNVQKALDAEFSGIESKLKYQQLLLDLNRDNLTSEQEKRAQQFELALRQQEQQVAQAREERQNVYSLATEVASLGTAPQQIIDRALSARTTEEALRILSPYMSQAGANLETQVVKLDNGQTVLLNTQTGEIISNIGGAYGGGSTGITGAGGTSSEYTSALNTILASGSFTKLQSQQITNAINSGQDPFTVIRNTARNLLTGASRTDVEKLEQAQQQMISLDSLMRQYYSQGGDTNIFTGTMEKVANRLGEVRDPALVGIATQIATALQAYRNAISGTAYSEQEGRDIASIFPGIDKTEGLNTAIINARLESFNTIIDSAYRGVLGSEYDRLKELSGYGSTTQSNINTQNYDDSQVFDSVVEQNSTSSSWIGNLWNTITSFF